MESLQELLYKYPAYKEAEQAFETKGKHIIYGLGGSQKSFIYSQAIRRMGMKPTIIIVHDKEHKERWERDLAFLLPQIEVVPFPITEKVAFITAARSLENQALQMRALGKLLTKKPVVVVATIEEATQYILSPKELKEYIINLDLHEEVNRETLLEKLVASGYERTDQVEQRGHFSVRGDILDIYPVNSDNPYRIEFFDDEIDTIRIFSRDTQRSIEVVEDCTIMPFNVHGDNQVSADAIEETDSLLSYGSEGLVIYDEPNRLQDTLKGFLKEDATHRAHHMTWSELLNTAQAYSEVGFNFLQQRISSFGTSHTVGLQGKSMISFERQIPLLTDEIKAWQERGRQIILVMNNRQRLDGIERALTEAQIEYERGDELAATNHKVLIVEGLLTDGFELPHCDLVVVTEGNIFGQQKKKLRKKAAKGQEITYFSDLTLGDYVVHTVHGIGKYVGLKTIETEGIHKDYIEIAYAGTDRLYLPADNLDQLQKYIGNEGDVPKIHKMGGREWGKVRQKAQKSIDDLAEKLVQLYAEREVVEGYAFLPDQPWQQEFEEAFPYEETEDQLQATREIKASMEKPTPMDRLLCGDVGFGKTEVAMRAIFKAVMSGKQVAVLVPTTVLAQQHYQTFLDRIGAFGVRVDVLNRFRSAKEKKDIIKRASEGELDVLIGTHALLNKKVTFRNLGLLVVDEEQRFGVAQKEKWKSWAQSIDVLTLSATPIPRTLHMSLVGVREMSVINTPPEERLPVQTYVVEYDMKLIVDAIRREIQRGGQVYFVYNRVASIGHMAELLEQAMPDLRFAIAHGQMTGAQMESIMVDFYEGQYDLLLCTSIIETGLDIPNANTIIVYDADHLGLSQLYQMRGRVGRSRRRAYAYFMYRPDKMLSETAEKRLKAIEEFTELGAGFKLAMRDLEIRGAGNLLGSQQHGNIASVGFALYCSMLEEAIAKAQHREVKPKELAAPSINLEVDAFIDDAYIKDSARKIQIYQRLLQIHSLSELRDFTDELIDRFGTPTDPVNRLLQLAMLKEKARVIGIKSIVKRNQLLTFVWADDSKMSEWDMGAVPAKEWDRMKVLDTKPASLTYQLAGLTAPIQVVCDNVLNELSKRESTVEASGVELSKDAHMKAATGQAAESNRGANRPVRH
ncbi:transcription-repair coupling factor [uncultured Veillonella sp.]|uniref:transcription-repair coupling factor n=1 Tax=uncultured Veillonella sp. TaxID=159268 RepID=UPI0026177F2D|nr:transcription-repair coupling factor [uncultured Veillonella sp.]